MWFMSLYLEIIFYFHVIFYTKFTFMLAYFLIRFSFSVRMYVNSVFSHYISSIFILLSVHNYIIFNFTEIN